MKNQKKYFNTALVAALATSSVAVVAPVATEASANFTDVKGNDYFYNAVMDLQAREIIKGFEDGTFRPNAFVTRGQAAKMIAGALGLNTTTVTNPNFTDVPTIHQYYGAIAALANAGVIKGFEDGTFRQGEFVQRNHVAKMIAGAMNLTAGEQEVPFTDVRADYKEAVAALFTNGVTTGKTATTFDGASNVTRGQVAAFIARAEKATADAVVVEGDAVTFTVSDYTATNVTIDDVNYTYDAAVRSIFADANKAALTGAKMTVTVADGVITKVNAITFNKAGNVEAPVTFAADATVDTLTVNADYVAVKNVTVTGDVVVTNNVAEEVDFDGVTIDGNLIVDEAKVGAVASINNGFAKTAKKGPRINLKKSKVRHIHVKRDHTAIKSDEAIAEITVATAITSIQVDGAVTKMNVQSTNTLVISGNASFAEVVLVAAVQLSLNITGVIDALVVNHADAKINMATTVTVTKLSLPKGAKAENIVANFVEVAKQVLGIFENKPASTGGGSSSSADKDDKADDNKGKDDNDSAVEQVATQNLEVQVVVPTLFESLTDLHAIVDGKTYKGVTYEMTPTSADTTTMKFTLTLPKGTEINFRDQFNFTVTYKDNTTEVITVFYGSNKKWIVAPQQSYLELQNLYPATYGFGDFRTQSGKMMTIDLFFEDYGVRLSWENGEKIDEGQYFKTYVEAFGKEYVVAFKYLNGEWTLFDEYFAGLVHPQQGGNEGAGEIENGQGTGTGNEPVASTMDSITFTFAQSTSADISTITVTDIYTVGTADAAKVTSADSTSVTTGDTLRIQLGTLKVTTADTVVIVITDSQGAKTPYEVKYNGTEWVATVRETTK